MTAAADAKAILTRLGVSDAVWTGDLPTRSPIDGSSAGSLVQATPDQVEAAVARSVEAFKAWRRVPAPRRGELVRLLGEELRAAKTDLAMLVTLEAGKIVSEGLGEAQEMIDICDFAVGLSRQLYGLTLPSERPGHHMRETWQPLGPVAVVTAFNFPIAVWAWNAALALVCGDPVIWKPSEKTPLTALGVQAVFERAVARFGDAPEGLSQLLIGGREIGEALSADPRAPLVSATGSTRMGKAVARTVAGRLGRSLLELGGNNAMIVTPSADLEMAVRAIAFSAVGTAGQRCTSLRRLIVHESVAEALTARLVKAYATLPVGDPRKDGVLVGPLIDEAAVTGFETALSDAVTQGGQVLVGGTRVEAEGTYVTPAIVRMPAQTAVVEHETFAPILYVLTWSDFDQAVELQNAVPQGLSSCVFTDSVREAEAFLSAWGSDCGIANVNIGPSGAEIGGAFGGEKETGGGRESGSDAWKAYMRRQTQTVNFSADLPLAQGVKFDV
ncbi:L-piperidine-6-carboxylate dehydrogenase [Brevundimonas goettingensis]|uniref:aldehyde dehydrogenase (NAD(+)) n=1 Tax=Brevundimonas goettingensis TaxID=2774190 RepID=A0A975GVH4_9CAUL|nr:aldehyde dehydrogenase family protein [Brevundimonas goettingensis]QTC91422.1 aldehyde dehydrogenase family protein [Brevundimonas goettingensis]